MEIKVRDRVNHKIYSNDMSKKDKACILSIHFCTGYTQVEVQDEIIEEGKIIYKTHSIILPPLNGDSNWLDSIATLKDNHGKWITY